MTVLGADAALRVAQHADLHTASEARLAHFQRRTEQVGKPFIGPIEHGAREAAFELFPVEHVGNHPVEIDIFKPHLSPRNQRLQSKRV